MCGHTIYPYSLIAKYRIYLITRQIHEGGKGKQVSFTRHLPPF